MLIIIGPNNIWFVLQILSIFIYEENKVKQLKAQCISENIKINE
jgi:hypothetical protein